MASLGTEVLGTRARRAFAQAVIAAAVLGASSMASAQGAAAAVDASAALAADDAAHGTSDDASALSEDATSPPTDGSAALADDGIPSPPLASVAAELGTPTAPEPSRVDAARQLASLAIDEAAIGRQRDGAAGERVLATSLFVGGVTIVFVSVSLFVIAALQGACVAEADLGCYDASEYMVGGLASGAIGAVLLSGAGFADRRAGFLEDRVRERETELEERREQLQRRVGLALGPGSVALRVSF